MPIEPAPLLPEMERELSSDGHRWDSGKVRQGNEEGQIGEKLSKGELKPVNLNRCTETGVWAEPMAAVAGDGMAVPFMKALPLQ